MQLAVRAARAFSRALLPAAEHERLEHLQFHDAGHGWDRLGLRPDAVRASAAATRFLYEVWFRVDSRGGEQIPSSGPAILAANHSGMLPVDGMMLWADVLRRTEPPRVARVVADRFVPRLPLVYTAFSRNGVVSGNRATLERLLGDSELLAVFPEGVPGIAKPPSERYRLQPFRVGHAELAIRFRAPIVPVAIVGAEEQWPELARIESFHLFGAPYLPIPATPFPLPVRYRIRYGAPIDPRGRFAPEQADDPTTTRALAREVQSAVQALIDEALRERKGIFR
ncbi:MAG: acyltransferase family protein [Myxococcota bacterium]|nr:acyltransferase family protein [Myxococcota bacterium]